MLGVLVLGGVIWLLWSGIAVDVGLHSEVEPEGPDTEIIGATVRTYGDQDSLLYEMTADVMVYNRNEGVYHVKRPRIRNASADEDWLLTAGEAVISMPSTEDTLTQPSRITLTDGVLLEGPSGKFRTTTVFYDPKEQIVVAPEAVSLEQANQSTQAVGMRLDLTTGHYDLNTHAEGKTQVIVNLQTESEGTE